MRNKDFVGRPANISQGDQSSTSGKYSLQSIQIAWGSSSIQGEGYGCPRGEQAAVTPYFSGWLWQTTLDVTVEKKPNMPYFL